MQLKGRNYLITGASRGIGRGCAVEIARAGGNVCINYHSQHEEANATADAVRALGGKAVLAQGDVSDYSAVEEMVARTREELGELHGFVSNAVYSDRESFLDADLEGFRRTIDVSMWGAFHGVRAAGRAFREQGNGGAMVVISSPHGIIPFPQAMAYNMAKAAIDHMARTAATELFSQRTRVNIVHPGWIDTPGERKYFSEEQIAAGAQKLPWGRLGRAEEIGRAVTFLLSDDAEYMTGSTLTMDGGVCLPWWSNREGGEL